MNLAALFERHVGLALLVASVLVLVWLALAWSAPWTLPLVALVIVGMGSFAVGTWRRSQGEAQAEARAATQSQLVGLLLHDYGEGAQHWIWEADPEGRLRSVSPWLARQLGRDPADLAGLPLAEALVDDPSQLTVEEEEVLEELKQRWASRQTFHDQEVPVPAAGLDRRWRLSARPLFDATNVLTGWLGVGTDITESVRIAMQNRRLAIIDDLTGLVNRRKLQEVLHDLLSPRSGGNPFTLIVIDLQNFRMVNEGLGHEVGDLLLRAAARRLLPLVPAGGLLARLGGDEFALLLPGAEERAVTERVSLLRRSTDTPFDVDGHRLEVSYQMGIASAPRDAVGATELLKNAELALHDAKRHRRGTAITYEAHLGTAALDRIRLHNELKAALFERQFELHYQPQVRADSGTLVGAEALIRWRHPVRGLVSPASFIPALEETGLIIDVGLWVLEEACREALTWPEDEHIAVNVSAVQFTSRNCVEAVQRVLQATGFPPSRLELEITESVMAQDSDAIVETLNGLRSLGIAVALDDFGTGYSSLSYLRQLPLDKLKVDQSFVRGLEQDPSAAAIVQAVLDLARALGLATTAEGIETEAQRDRLRGLGVDHMQGYLFSRPVPASGLAAFRKGTS